MQRTGLGGLREEPERAPDAQVDGAGVQQPVCSRRHLLAVDHDAGARRGEQDGRVVRRFHPAGGDLGGQVVTERASDHPGDGQAVVVGRVVIPFVEPVSDAAGGQPEAQPMKRRAVLGFAVEFKGVQANLGRRAVGLRGGRQGADDPVGATAHPRLARDGVDASPVAGHEGRPAVGIGDAVLDFVDQPMQRAVAAVADEVGGPWIELLDGPAEILDGRGLVHLAPGADDPAQVGGAVRRGAILARLRIDDDG